ncbi:MAG: hypothetical protein JKY48_16520 [Flavobacteriales bacterium]|nr:hypothetical protein [Flavobacteriales bacterium]
MKRLGSVLIIMGFLLFACNSGDGTSAIHLEEENAIEEGGVTLIPILNELEEKGFALAEYEYLDKARKAKLSFDVDLSEEIEIHYSINNGEIHKCNTAEFELDFLEGNNVLMAYLSLKNGLRLPSDSTVFIRNFYVGEDKSGFNSLVPHLFHHIPEEVDSADFIMGFYLNNVPQLRGCQVKFMIDGINFLLPYEKAFKLVGLSKETHNLRIQLVNHKGQLISGPFNDSGVMHVKVV